MKGIKDKKTGLFVANLSDKSCFQCHRIFHPRTSMTQFCSLQCRSLSQIKDHSRKCIECDLSFSAQSLKTRFCSHQCYGLSLEKPRSLKVFTEPVASFMCKVCHGFSEVFPSRSLKAKYCSRSCRAKYYHGEKSFRWKKDRNSLKKKQKRNDSAYLDWRKEVCKRDDWLCRIGNQDCGGKLEVHHILSWRSYPELRYQINNGITLCHAHHPRKREDEAKLSPYFQELVAEKN